VKGTLKKGLVQKDKTRLGFRILPPIDQRGTGLAPNSKKLVPNQSDLFSLVMFRLLPALVSKAREKLMRLAASGDLVVYI